jgi:TPR repeat protein/serine/threonine protein kinase
MPSAVVCRECHRPVAAGLRYCTACGSEVSAAPSQAKSASDDATVVGTRSADVPAPTGVRPTEASQPPIRISTGPRHSEPVDPASARVCPQCGGTFDLTARFCPADGSMLRLQSSSDDLVGQVLEGRYEIRRLLGEGGMGRVYLAEQIKMHRLCALKVMRPEQMHEADAADRFGREAFNASRIVHPHVATIYDFGETNDGRLYIAMEYVDGRPLSELLAREGALPIDRAIDIGLQIGQALGAAHDLGIVHRDLKPDNVMLATTKTGRDLVKVVDFGIAKAAQGEGQTITRTGLIVGTPQYMSPEQIAGDPLDGRSDVYALGCILFKLLTGSDAFTGTGQEILMRRLVEAPPRPKALKPDVPSALDDVVVRALARFPRDRFENADALSAALSAVKARAPEPPQPAAASPVKPPALSPAPLTPSPRTPPPVMPLSSVVAGPQVPAVSQERQAPAAANSDVADPARASASGERTRVVVRAPPTPVAPSPVSAAQAAPSGTASVAAAAARAVKKWQPPRLAVPGVIAVAVVAVGVALAMHRTANPPVVSATTQPPQQTNRPSAGQPAPPTTLDTSRAVTVQPGGSRQGALGSSKSASGKSSDPGVAATSRAASAQAMYDRGLAASRDKRYDEAFGDFQQAANAGNVDAMVAVGGAYARAQGVAQDTQQSRLWYQKAANAGNYEAMSALGHSAWLAEDYPTARTWFEKAAAGGDAAAMGGLGNIYRNAQGVPQDFQLARQWYEKAAVAGNSEAMKHLGDMYLTAQGVPQDYGQARQLYEKAVSAGNTQAMNAMGYLYFRGLGVSQDYQQARHWYENAAVRGDVGGMFALGSLFEQGWGVSRDYAQARDWYEQAAARGDVTAMFRLGLFFESGLGIPRDFQQARTWYEKAVAGGNGNAMYRLGRMLEYGEGGGKDLQRAFQLYQQAAAQGNKPAIDRLQKAGQWPGSR